MVRRFVIYVFEKRAVSAMAGLSSLIFPIKAEAFSPNEIHRIISISLRKINQSNNYFRQFQNDQLHTFRKTN